LNHASLQAAIAGPGIRDFERADRYNPHIALKVTENVTTAKMQAPKSGGLKSYQACIAEECWSYPGAREVWESTTMCTEGSGTHGSELKENLIMWKGMDGE